MPITFGSVGDLISVSLIVKDLVKALDDSRGSAAEYQEIIRELLALDRALLEVELLSKTCEETVELNALCMTARHIAGACSIRIRSFLGQINRYKSSLGTTNAGHQLRDFSMKIRWKISHGDELDKVRAEINAHCSSLNMLLITASVIITQLNDKKLLDRQTVTERKFQQATELQHDLLRDIRTQITENTQSLASIKSSTESVVSALRLEWLKTLGLELKSLMGRIFVMNLAIFRAVLEIRASLPSYLERCLTQEPFVLEDAIGRIAPVHMQFITSWEAFDSVLDQRFRNMPGHSKILSKEYILQDHTSRRDIVFQQPWEGTFLPGQRIDMSIVFDNVRERLKLSCPRCQHVGGKQLKGEVQCASCLMWYSRLTEPLNNKRPKPAYQSWRVLGMEKSFPRERRNLLVSAAFGPKPPTNSPGGTKRPFDEAEPGNEIAPFKRVRLIHRKYRLEQQIAHSTQHFTTKLYKRESQLGSWHPRTIKARLALAGHFRTLRNFDAAEKLLQRALDSQDKLRSSDNLIIPRIIEAMITILVDQNRLDRAEGASRELIELLRDQLGPEHVDTTQGEEQLRFILQLRKAIPNAKPQIDSLEARSDKFSLNTPRSVETEEFVV